MKLSFYKKIMLACTLNFLIACVILLLIYLKPPAPIKLNSDNPVLIALVPHPPMMIPEIGGIYSFFLKKTAISMELIAKTLVSSGAETVIIITPHPAFDEKKFRVFNSDYLEGDFDSYGLKKGLNFRQKNDKEFIKNLKSLNFNKQIEIENTKADIKLDQGVLVPLYYLDLAGYNGKIAVINYSGQGVKEHIELGKLIKKATANNSKKYAILASGVLSHKLKSFSPSGYEPETKILDKTIIEAFKTGNFTEVKKIPPEILQISDQCAYNSLLTAYGVTEGNTSKSRILSYEAPFGIGYLVAILK